MNHRHSGSFMDVYTIPAVRATVMNMKDSYCSSPTVLRVPIAGIS